MKALPLTIQKFWRILIFFFNDRQTGKQTNRWHKTIYQTPDLLIRCHKKMELSKLKVFATDKLKVVYMVSFDRKTSTKHFGKRRKSILFFSYNVFKNFLSLSGRIPYLYDHESRIAEKETMQESRNSSNYNVF